MSEPTPPPLPRSAAKPASLWRDSLEAHNDVENGVQGISGWLILFTVSLFISPFIAAYGVLTIGRILVNPAVWERLTSPDSPAYHPLWSPVLIFELVGNLVRVLFCLGLLILLFTRRRIFPPLAIVYLIALLGFAWVDHLLSQQIPAIRDRPASQGFANHLQTTLYVLIWAPYFWMSERVRNTFVR